jgi:curved DNA-binding protein CbpA
MMPTLYELLGVERTATAAAIEEDYRQLALESYAVMVL